MKVLTAITMYLFLCGVFIGPWLGEKMRCGEKTPPVHEMLGIAATMPLMLGASLTAGEMPEAAKCKPTSNPN